VGGLVLPKAKGWFRPYIYTCSIGMITMYIYTHTCVYIGSSNLISYNLAKIQGSNNLENYILEFARS
jgi:hypothetical protein